MGRSIQTGTPTVRGVRTVVPMEKGGTGVSHEANLPIALGIIPKTSMGIPNGVAVTGTDGLIQNNQLPSSAVPGVTINGPDEIFPGQTVTFTITNYDVNTSYVLQVSAGTIERSGKTITYVAPSSAQAVTMTVNGRECNFPVKPAAPVKPSIVAPIYNGVISTTSYTFTSSAYAGSALPHASSDWQLATDIDFTTVLNEIINSATDKTTWILSNLSNAALLFVRVRHKAQDGSYSAWSDPSRLSVDTTFTFNPVIAALTYDYNMKAAAIAAGWDQIKPLNMSVTVNAGVTIGSSSTSVYAFDTGLGFPSGSSLTLINNGFVVGRGGAGGGGAGWNSTGEPGSPGGPALRAQSSLIVVNTNGTIGGGGGGGGGAGTAANQGSGEYGGGGGGGGAGALAGVGGGSSSNGVTAAGATGNTGTTTTGGSGGAAGNGDAPYGGTGGALGAAGGAGQNSANLGGAGGQPGVAITGNSNITWSGLGTRLGTIN